jgi:hypothetical protein
MTIKNQRRLKCEEFKEAEKNLRKSLKMLKTNWVLIVPTLRL